jgi:hypothetical protein
MLPPFVAHNASATVIRVESDRAHMFYDQDKAAAARFLCLDIVDWSMLLVAIALTALAVALA